MSHEARVAAGLKAAISNPNVSEEAKERAAQRLEHMGAAPEVHSQAGTHDSNRVLGGYKATLHNDRTSEAAKKHALNVLEGNAHEDSEEHHEEVHESRVLAGYKATLHNPRVSEEAKDHAEEILREAGEL